MKASGKQTTSLWLENKNQINIIDQTQLPFKTAIINLRNTSDFCEAITKMKVRGAPLIGVTAAFGLALAIKQNPNCGCIITVSGMLFMKSGNSFQIT